MEKIITFLVLVLAVFALSKVPPSVIHIENPNTASVVISPEEKFVTILAFGDMMFDRGVRYYMNKYGSDYPFINIRGLLRDSDIILANLEGPITSNSSKTLGKKDAPLQFTFATTTASLIKNEGITLVGLANNHTLNFGNGGLLETKKYLLENDIDYFGDPLNADEISIIKNINGIKIGFVGYHEFSYKNYDKIISEIVRLRSVTDFLIVFAHWGVEYNVSYTEDQQNKAHEFIDNGADLVIGAHPHVVEPVEEYKNKKIFYSLGNFIFDQDFSYNTTHGLAIRITIPVKDIEGVTYDLIPFSVIKSQVSLI
ncbi:MAG: CapA family protein [Patescibacteria group bacterium]|nr:CapA family protein [Patescibacteria group bacterium]